MRIVTVTVGLALLVGATVACQPPHPDNSWSIQQLVLADGREPREGKPVTISMRGHDSAVLGGSQVLNDLLGRYGWESGPNLGLGPVGQGYYPMIDLSAANGPCVAYVPRPPDDFNPRLFLDLLGFVPVIGDVVDGGLCVWDGSAAAFADGSTTNAAISCLAIIPLLGSFGKLGKWIPTPSGTGWVQASDLVEAPLWTAAKNKTSAQNAYRHFADHGGDFADIQNSVEYVAKAQDFLRTPPGGTLTRIRANGDVVRWHPGSNTFGVMDASEIGRAHV